VTRLDKQQQKTSTFQGLAITKHAETATSAQTEDTNCHRNEHDKKRPSGLRSPTLIKHPQHMTSNQSGSEVSIQMLAQTEYTTL
jgi:hypothetical protein